MKYLLLFFVTTIFCTCTQPPKEASKAPINVNYATFKFSEKPPATDGTDLANWCVNMFGIPALISADPKNYNRRLFAVGDVPTRVVVYYKQLSAVFVLYKVGNHVEVYTSDNLPGCLSNRTNLQISPEGVLLRYNNKAGIDIDVHLQEFPSGIQIALDLPPGGNHGLTVHRCETCR
ncbi:MAG: hypothetical protein ACKVU0_11670 [Saprospiraceae bacterium]